MNVLAIDAAGAACSAAVWHQGRILGEERIAADRGHAEILMPMLTRVLARAGLGFGGIEGLAVTVGPGSFTGIRTAIATARGLALALDRPVVGVTTLEALALDARRASVSAADCLVVLDTRRADLYAQVFVPDGAPRKGPEAAMPEDIAAGLRGRDILLAGNAAQGLEPLLLDRGFRVAMAPGDGSPDACVVAEIGAGRLVAQCHEFPATPLYLRPPDAIKPVDGGRLQR